MLVKIKEIFHQLCMRIGLLGLAVVSTGIGCFFIKILMGIVDKYDVSTADGQHIDFFKAGVHLPAIMIVCFVGICFFWLAFFLVKEAFSRWNSEEEKQDENQESMQNDLKEVKQELVQENEQGENGDQITTKN